MEDSYAFLLTIGIQQFRRLVKILITYCQENGKLRQIYLKDQTTTNTSDYSGSVKRRITDVKHLVFQILQQCMAYLKLLRPIEGLGNGVCWKDDIVKEVLKCCFEFGPKQGPTSNNSNNCSSVVGPQGVQGVQNHTGNGNLTGNHAGINYFNGSRPIGIPILHPQITALSTSNNSMIGSPPMIANSHGSDASSIYRTFKKMLEPKHGHFWTSGMYMYNVHVQCIMYMYIVCRCTMHMYNVHVHSVYMYIVCTCTMHMYNLHKQCIRFMYNV